MTAKNHANKEGGPDTFQVPRLTGPTGVIQEPQYGAVDEMDQTDNSDEQGPEESENSLLSMACCNSLLNLKGHYKEALALGLFVGVFGSIDWWMISSAGLTA